MNNDGTTDSFNQLNSEQYKELYQNEIDIFNQAINKTKIIVDITDKFIIRGNNSDYDIDALIWERIDDYIWIKNMIYDLVLSKNA